MKASIQNKLEHIASRHEEIAALLAEPEVQSDQNKFRSLSQEYAQISSVVDCYHQYQAVMNEIESAQLLTKDEDPEMRELALMELEEAVQKKEALQIQLQVLLLPEDPDDTHNVFLEIRAGTGGAESALFAGSLFRMYSKYAETQKWQVEILSASEGEHGGYKELITRIMGNNVYSQLKFESGAHRVQRVPETESQGRVHTSACTVAILPEAEAVDEINIDPSDLRIDTYRASGAGGQHINKTDSAVRITHLPTNTVVECQDERSQHKNKARALSLLSSKLLAVEKDKQAAEQSQNRRQLVGSGDRSERIRTYNFPQGRMTDHRINLTLYKLEEIMEGDISQVIEPLRREYQADMLASLDE